MKEETITAKVTELKKKYPAALHPIFDRAKEILPYLRPDIIIRIDKTDCMKVAFTLTYVPLLADVIQPPDVDLKLPIDVLVHDENGVTANRRYFVARTGEEIKDTVELPLPKNITPVAGWARVFFVLADPLNRIAERQEGNNFATLKGVC